MLSEYADFGRWQHIVDDDGSKKNCPAVNVFLPMCCAYQITVVAVLHAHFNLIHLDTCCTAALAVYRAQQHGMQVSSLYNILSAVHSLHVHRVVHCDLHPHPVWMVQ